MEEQITVGEHLSKFREFITGGDGEREPRIKWFKELVMLLRRELKNKVVSSAELHPTFGMQCPPCIAGHFLMAENVAQFRDGISRDVEDSLKKSYGTLVHEIQWTAEADRQFENKLWTLFVCQKVIEGFSLKDYENVLSVCFDSLLSRRSHVMCLMLWLFSGFATQERIGIVEDIVADTTQGGRWLLRDRMLLGLASIENESFSQEKKTRVVETHICELQDSVVRNGDDLCSDAIGLLMFVFCAKRNISNFVVGAVSQTVQRVVERLIEFRLDDNPNQYYASDLGWAYYALCEYVNLLRRV